MIDVAGLKSATIEEGVLAIKDWVFDNCYALEEINLPKSINYLGEASLCIAWEGYGFGFCVVNYAGTKEDWDDIEIELVVEENNDYEYESIDWTEELVINYLGE